MANTGTARLVPYPVLLKRLWQHLTLRRRRQIALLMVLILLSGFAETVSLGAVLPFLGILTSPARVMTHLVRRVPRHHEMVDPDLDGLAEDPVQRVVDHTAEIELGPAHQARFGANACELKRLFDHVVQTLALLLDQRPVLPHLFGGVHQTVALVAGERLRAGAFGARKEITSRSFCTTVEHAPTDPHLATDLGPVEVRRGPRRSRLLLPLTAAAAGRER